MARTPDPHSATAQFFINTADNDFLDFRTAPTQQGHGYAVFGRVSKAWTSSTSSPGSRPASGRRTATCLCKR